MPVTKGAFVEVSLTATVVGMSGSKVTRSHSSAAPAQKGLQALTLVPHSGTSGAPVAMKLVHGPRGKCSAWMLYVLDAEELLG